MNKSQGLLKNGNAVMNNALAGVGRPMNESVCCVSILNFASRSAEKMVRKNATYGSKLLGEIVLISWNITMPGRTPKLTTSASESSSFPIGELAFNILAIKPSRKSNTQAAQTNHAPD